MSNKKDVQVNIEIKANTDGVDTAIHKVDRLLDQLFAKEKSLKSNNSLGNSLIPDGDLAKIDSAVNKLLNIRNELSNVGSTGGSVSGISTLNSEISKIEENAKKFGLLGVVVRENTGYISEFDRVVDELNSDLDFSDDIDEFLGLGDSINDAGNALQDLDNSANDVANTQNNLDNSLNNVSDSILDATIKYKIGTKALEVGKKIYDEYGETLKKVGKAAIDAGASIVKGFGYAVDTVSELLDITENALSKFKELADSGTELQAGWFKLYNYLGEQGGSKYTSYLNELHDVLSLDTDYIVGDLEGLLSMVDNLNLSLDKSGEAMEAFTNFGLDLSTFSGESFGDIVTQLENAVNLNVLNSRSALAHALNLDDTKVEEFKKLNSTQERANYLLSRGEEFRGNYQKWLETAGGKVSQMNNAVSSLTGNIQKLSTGLLAKFAPVITAIIKLLDRLVSLLSKVFGIDLTSAADNMAEGFDGIVGGADSASNALETTTEASKKLERQVAGFDDVIQINDSTNNGTDINDTLENLNSIVDIDFSSWLNDLVPEPSELEKKLGELYKIIEEGKWSQAGIYIRDMIVDSLNGIDWDSIGNKVTDFSSGLSNLLAGLLSDGTLGESVGTTIANLINTIVDGLNAFFVNSALFENLGLTIAKGIKSLFENLDTDDISTLLYYVVRDIFTSFNTFLDTMEEDGTWSLIGTKISDIINGFFSSFTVEDVENAANDVIRFIDGVVEMICTFAENLDTEDIKTKVTAFVRKLFEGFKEHQDEWAATLKEFTSFITDMLSTIIEEWDSSGMSNAIIKFIQDSGIGEMVWELVKTKFKIKYEEFKITFLTFLGELLGDIGEKIGHGIGYILVILGGLAEGIFGIGYRIGEFLFDEWENIGEFFSNIFNDITGFFTRLSDDSISFGENLKTLFFDVLDSIKEYFSNRFDDIIGLFTSLWEDISGIASKVWEKISGLFDGLSGLKESISSVWDGITSLPDNISLGVSGIDIPFLANGGIVKRTTLAAIGEDGAEAVVPLQNNTEWMDQMAKSLVNAMDNKNGGIYGSGSTIVIDMSQCTKQVYTRSEMQAFGKLVADALNTYGANVSYNY